MLYYSLFFQIVFLRSQN